MKTKIIALSVVLFGATALSSCTRLYHSRSYVKTEQQAKKTEQKEKMEAVELAAIPQSVETPNPTLELSQPELPVMATNPSKIQSAENTGADIQIDPVVETTVTEALVQEVNNDEQVLDPVETKPEGKSQLVALLLCIFLGYIGIHRFYLGYTTIGILQIITLGGCGIWALIDLIRIITGDLKPKDGEYAEKLEDI